MEKVIVNNLNESYVQVSCNQGIAWELRDYFTFKVPGYQFTPQYKARLWSGDIRLFDVRSNRIYRGLAPKIEEFCKERDYEYEYEDNYTTEFSVEEAEHFIQGLGLPHTAHDFQMDSFIHAIRNHRGLYLSPTASGKSLIIYSIIRYLQDALHKKRILILVPRISLVSQLSSDFSSYGYDSDANVHGIYGGQAKHTDRPVTISTWQSIYKEPKEYFQQFDVVIGDEAHQFKSKSLCHIMESCTKTSYRIGLTGTLDGTQTHKLVLEGLFGTVRKVATSAELMQRGIIAQLLIKCLVLKHTDQICKQLKNSTYQEEIKFLINNEIRNRFIGNLALSLEGNTLVLFNYIKHGKLLYDLINIKANKSGCPIKRKVFFVYGQTDIEIREEMRGIVEKETDAIIIASYGTTSTGVNIKNLHNVIFASPSRSRIRNLQSIGRGLRISDSKSEATLFDISDDLRWKTHKNYTLNHYEERIRTYAEEKFKFKIYKIEIGK